jgi:hypothetical protein
LGKDRLAILLNVLLVVIPYISLYWSGQLCYGLEMYVGSNEGWEKVLRDKDVVPKKL